MSNQPEPKATKSTVFVTGATGFIGQNLVAGLLAKGHRVLAMIRPDQQSDQRLPPGCQQIPVDLMDVDKLTDIVSTSSATIYCAGSVRGRGAGDFASANVEGVRALAQALGESASRQPLLLLSSLAASQPHLSDYAFSKHAGERILYEKRALPWTILRPPAVYGPGDREMLPLLKLIRRGWVIHPGPREQRLSLLHVDDLVRAVEAWLGATQQCLHKTYAIDDGTPGGYDWTEIAGAVSEKAVRLIALPRFMLSAAAQTNLLLSFLFRYAPMLTPGKVRELIQPQWLCDNRVFGGDTAWRPRLDLRLGTQQLFAPKRTARNG